MQKINTLVFYENLYIMKQFARDMQIFTIKKISVNYYEELIFSIL